MMGNYWCVFGPDGEIHCEPKRQREWAIFEAGIGSRYPDWSAMEADGYRCHKVKIVRVEE